jgi:cyclase
VEPQLLTDGEGVYAWIGAGGDSNAGAVVTPHGIIAIDAQQYPRLARQFRAAVEAKTGKPVCMLINTHCHLDHTAGNIVFADLPILAHDKTLAAMHANLGTKNGAYWTISDYPTKIKMLFGQNLFDLVPENDPAQAWFRQRIGLPDYDTMKIAPPTQTFADHFTFNCRATRCTWTIGVRRIATATSSSRCKEAESFFLATCCSTAGSRGSAIATSPA